MEHSEDSGEAGACSKKNGAANCNLTNRGHFWLRYQPSVGVASHQNRISAFLLRYGLWFPPVGKVNAAVCGVVGFTMVYGIIVSVLQQHYALPIHASNKPSAVINISQSLNTTVESARLTSDLLQSSKSAVFYLYILLISSLLAGYMARVVWLPDLLGMLIMGILLRNVPCISLVATGVPKRWSSVLRKCAFAIVLLQGGLSLDLGALRKLKSVVLRLAFVPCVVEAFTVAAMAYALLGLPWRFGIMLGFVIGAVSPAVCVPSMLRLQEKGFGVEEGIPTLVMAASSTDDVLAITAFSVVLSITFSQGSVALTLVKGPIDVFIGVCYGGMLGVLFWYIPENTAPWVWRCRGALLTCAGALSMFGSAFLGVDGAGALGCLTVAAVAAHGWSKGRHSTPQNPVSECLSVLWWMLQPFLFGLIGAEIDLSTVGLRQLALTTAVLLAGVALRTVAAFLAVGGAGFGVTERVFVALAWLPKATVQAALGPVVYDTALDKGSDQAIVQYGSQIVSAAVLSILLTAPLGAALIALSGPRLLKRGGATEMEEEAPRIESAHPELQPLQVEQQL